MNDALSALPVIEELSPSVTRRLLGEIPVLVVDHPRVRGAVSLQGGQVLAWQPAGSAPGLWLGERNTWQAGKPVRGGVPLCWPWFGPAAKPSHGFARLLDWDLVAHEEREGGVLLALELKASEKTREVWPHEFTLSIRIVLGATCDIELEAQGDHSSTGALHTYLAVGALGKAEVSGLGGSYRDNLLAVDVSDVDGTVVPADHIERVYTEPEDVSLLRDEALGRVVELAHRGASDVVVWNPGAELAASMGDLTDEDHRHFLCVETGRINAPLVSTEERPGRLGLTLRLLPA
ncbi:D-hexose-6-phosphate mutarotase [Streptomyces sp. NA04227]|uniref:D-hexose-6-phosphate mutarotase n=1 Tax=Streptomyces sp. NA04227 TaxID=2742136 RepID=UPI0015920E4A|nr:D-hexose-6-phosphate mutarotase [Streptomyces sp. NA04227]QKW06549.1 D-hexose-6-phosphate mutarotase [Streptomyces sp. NA04227]